MTGSSRSISEAFRASAFRVAYRILGSVADAEDIAQETVARLIGGDAEARSPEALAATTAARLSLNHLRDARNRDRRLRGEDLPVHLVSLPDPAADARIDLSYGLMVLTMQLPPLGRAVFILRSAFDLSFDDIAKGLERTPAACRQAHSRAVGKLGEARFTNAEAGAKEAGVLRRLVALISERDVPGLVSLLAADVVLHSDGGENGPAFGKAFGGRERIAGFLSVSPSVVAADAATRVVMTVQGPLMLVEENGVPVVAVNADYRDGVITRLYAMSNPLKLRELSRQLDQMGPATA